LRIRGYAQLPEDGEQIAESIGARQPDFAAVQLLLETRLRAGILALAIVDGFLIEGHEVAGALEIALRGQRD
jgi:hypothetical protein